LNQDTIQSLAQQYVKAGADIIDVGMVAGESRPSDAKRIVKLVKQVVDVPVSIDTLDSAEIREAVEAGADFVLSADAGNLDEIAPYVSDVAVVVIPTNQRRGFFPKKVEMRVKFMEEMISRAKKLGITKCLADLILEPSDVLKSFTAFQQFAQRNPNIPLFVGVSNVTELFDADSVGVNALLTRLSSEVGASILLATEKSDKAKGTVSEEATAAKMMFLAKKRGSVPKDLGIDLLMLKDKRNHEEQYDKTIEKNVQVAIAEKPDATFLDPKGAFTLMLDRPNKQIAALYYLSAKKAIPDVILKGKTADEVYRKIIELNLISRLEHAGYLGAELAKAEVALRTGKEYIQDKKLFEK
jgi:dihydropteroate synthase-like protein